MNINEHEHKHKHGRTLILKPVASRPTISDFRPFSEPTAGATNGTHSSDLTATAVRPRTVRLESVMSYKPPHMVSSQVELTRTQSFNLSDKIMKPNHTSQLLYKPLAKTVSRTAISLLASMETFNGSHDQALARGLGSLSRKSGNDNIDESSYDGYNWRKYGQKQVKGSEYPRSYYKCTHPNCVVKKKVERSIDGRIVEVVYKDDHNHSKPRVPRRYAFDGSHGTSEDVNQQVLNNRVGYDDEDVGSSSRLTNLVKVKESKHHGSSEGFDASIQAPRVKKRRNLSQINEGVQEPRVIVHDGTDSEATSDGYRWRKYGQKVVKGNPYPRSYYRCSGVKCDVRKHVERTSDDPTVFITTYEGKHNHEMPIKKAS